MQKIILIVHNVRSSYNVGAILRSADVFGAEVIYLTGYSPCPILKDDFRLPHIAQRAERQIAKTALGAEKTTNWQYRQVVEDLISELRSKGYRIAALEQASGSTNLAQFTSPSRIALLVGREVGGVEEKLLNLVDEILEIPTLGQKNSLNVSTAAAIALYHLRYISPKQ